MVEQFFKDLVYRSVIVSQFIAPRKVVCIHSERFGSVLIWILVCFSLFTVIVCFGATDKASHQLNSEYSHMFVGIDCWTFETPTKSNLIPVIENIPIAHTTISRNFSYSITDSMVFLFANFRLSQRGFNVKRLFSTNSFDSKRLVVTVTKIPHRWQLFQRLKSYQNFIKQGRAFTVVSKMKDDTRLKPLIIFEAWNHVIFERFRERTRGIGP